MHLTLFVTGACNARCRHCFHHEEVAAALAGPSVEQVERLADSAATMGPLLWVSFGGGEPLLRKDLPALARAFGRRGLRHLAIPTNGMVEGWQHDTVEQILDENPEMFLSISVSFDGPPDVHDAIRQVKGGHARAMSSVRAYREQAKKRKNLGVGIIVTVSSENQLVLAEHLEELVDELSPDNVTVNLARGKALDPTLLNVDVSHYQTVVAAKERLMREGRLPYFDFPMAKLAVARDRLMYDHVAKVATDAPRRHLPCTAGTLSAVIFEGGEVFPCEMLDQPMGQLNDVNWDLSKLWSQKTANDLRRTIKDTHCECTWECAQADNVLFNPRSWPALLSGTFGLPSRAPRPKLSHPPANEP